MQSGERRATGWGGWGGWGGGLESLVVSRGRSLVIVLVMALVTLLGVASCGKAGPGGAGGSTTEEIKISLVSVGLKSQARAGEWTGILLQVTDSALQPREVVIQCPIQDPDGDTTLYRRAITTNPGVKQNVWLYVFLPFGSEGSTLTFEAFEAAEKSGGAGDVAPGTSGEAKAVAGAGGAAGIGRLLGRSSTTVNESNFSRRYSGQMAVVGRNAGGLDLYGVRSAMSGATPLGHEAVDLVEGVRVADLPDRWMGLASVSTLVWIGNTLDQDPLALTEAQAGAIKQWIQRGGHFVVVFPTVSQNWTAPSNKLADVGPRAQVARFEGVRLDDYRSILRDPQQQRDRPPLPSSSIVHLFKALPEAKQGEAVSILEGPGRRVSENDADNSAYRSLVMRRSLGEGAVTWVGLDVSTPSIAAVNAVQTDVFWHRVLGRRGEVISGSKFTGLIQKNEITESRSAIDVDDGIASSIAKTGAAAKGVLLAFVVFIAYWVLAGPLAFRVLKSSGRSQHAWLVFTGVSVIFTAIAWGGANLIKPTKTEAQHLTFITEVAGQNTQHAKVFASVFLPKFGTSTIGIKPEDGVIESQNAVAPWSMYATGLGGASVEKFPDSRGYPVVSRSPEALPVPSRSTVKTVMVDWLGGPRWKMPMALPEAPITVRALPESSPRPYAITGQIKHELPAALTNVRVIVVYRQFSLGSSDKRAVLASTAAVTIPEWQPGQVLDLSTVFDSVNARSGVSTLQTFTNNLVPTQQSYNFGRPQEEEKPRALSEDRLVGLSLFSVLPPPDVSPSMAGNIPHLRRSATHGLDLSRWVTQPCVMVIGHLATPTASPCPVPITVDGELIPTSGRTVVRWVYPLESNPPEHTR